MARTSPASWRGAAPRAAFAAWRLAPRCAPTEVFPDVGGGASNFDIAKAIDTAVADRCDIINMSLGGGPQDPLTQAAINRALAAGAAGPRGGRQ